jgi:L-iditol 2-dehydrogenase
MRALVFHGPGDLRLENVPRPEPVAEGDVVVQVEVVLTDGTDLKAFRRGHPVLLGPPPSPLGHEFCGVDVASGRRVVAAQQHRQPPAFRKCRLEVGACKKVMLTVSQ